MSFSVETKFVERNVEVCLKRESLLPGRVKSSLFERESDGLRRGEAPLNNALAPGETRDHFEKVTIGLLRELPQREL